MHTSPTPLHNPMSTPAGLRRSHGHLATGLTLLAVLTLGGCVTEDNDPSVSLGDVSLGEQLIDLKKARDSGAISAEEYRRMKEQLVTLLEGGATGERDDLELLIQIDADHDERTHKQRRDEAADSEDDEDDWIF